MENLLWKRGTLYHCATFFTPPAVTPIKQTPFNHCVYRKSCLAEGSPFPLCFTCCATKVDPKSLLAFISCCNLQSVQHRTILFTLSLSLFIIIIKRRMAELLSQQQGDGEPAKNRKIEVRTAGLKGKWVKRDVMDETGSFPDSWPAFCWWLM